MSMIVTFGEVMMRLTTRDSARITRAVSYGAHLGGSEHQGLRRGDGALASGKVGGDCERLHKQANW